LSSGLQARGRGSGPARTPDRELRSATGQYTHRVLHAGGCARTNHHWPPCHWACPATAGRRCADTRDPQAVRSVPLSSADDSGSDDQTVMQKGGCLYKEFPKKRAPRPASSILRRPSARLQERIDLAVIQPHGVSVGPAESTSLGTEDRSLYDPNVRVPKPCGGARACALVQYLDGS